MPKNVTVDEGKGCHCGWRTKDESLWMKPKDEALLMRPKDERLLKKTKVKRYKCPQLMNFWISWERRDPTAWAVDKGHLTNYNIWLWKGWDEVITFFVVVFALKSFFFIHMIWTFIHTHTCSYTHIHNQTSKQRNKHNPTNTRKETNTQSNKQTQTKKQIHKQNKKKDIRHLNATLTSKLSRRVAIPSKEINITLMNWTRMFSWSNSCSVSEHLLNCELNTLPFSLPKVWLCERFSVVSTLPNGTYKTLQCCLFVSTQQFGLNMHMHEFLYRL